MLKRFGELDISQFYLLVMLLQGRVTIMHFPPRNKHHLVIYIKYQSHTLKSVCRTASETFTYYHQTCGGAKLRKVKGNIMTLRGGSSVIAATHTCTANGVTAEAAGHTSKCSQLSFG